MGTVYVNSFTVILVLISVYNSNGFNLSPKPNIVLREPIGDGIPKMRSSYFGFSLNLKRNSVLVGAPREQSTIDKQRNINETGAIYKCSFDQNKSNKCAPFVFDSFGNSEEANNQYTYNNEMKDYQWLGASIDGGFNDNEKTVVCAPRMISNQSVHYLFHGVCYWTQDTSSNEPINVQKIAPLRLREKQSYKTSDDLTHFYYMYGEQGLNVHVTDNNEEILIGAPGVFMWKGSVIRHKAKPMFDLGDLSRRSDDATSFPRQRTTQEMLEYSSDIPNPLFWNQDDNSYFGFAVSSGYFDGIGKTKLLYVASAPQANLQQGAVYIFDIVDHFSGSDKTIKIYHTFPGQQLGEYFGYSLITEDFYGDGLTDIAIGAPYNLKTGDYENGAVYIYKNEGTSSNFVLHAVLQTEYELSGRFGTTLSKVGDINQDGFNDLMVGAPFEENGVVYIYHGGLNGLPTKPSQRIAALSNAFVSDSMFGHGLSKGADIDNNHYLDIAVGSPNSEAVYIYKSYPVIRINTSITPFSQEIQTTDKIFKFEVCWSFDSMHPIGFDVLFNATIRLDGQLGRAVFKDSRNEYKIDGNITSTAQCIMLESFVSFSVADIFRPIELEMVHHVQNGIPSADANTGETQDFCETCVAINPNDAKSVRNKLVFSTGCKSARCITDLKIKSSLGNIASLPYVLGSTSSLNIIYNVENAGETAYLPRIQVMLPAPRAQSTVKVQKSINETGAIYKCHFNNLANERCAQFIFESRESGTYANIKKLNDLVMTQQWLGASMDGSANENDLFVVCAPFFISSIANFRVNGICYSVTNTSMNSPDEHDKKNIAALNSKDKQEIYVNQHKNLSYFSYGKQGLSVHITEDNEEILIGAPGVYEDVGTVIRYKPINHFEIPNAREWYTQNQNNNSYFGYAVSSGYFDVIGKKKMLYLASTPRDSLRKAAVYIFDIVDNPSKSDKIIKIHYTFPGQQLGEYFGYSLITEDFDGDGLTDIAIGAPYNSKTGDYENGAVYIYKNKGTSSNFVLHAVLQTEFELSGRFGTTLSKVGDINQDGFNDLMVGAPFEENGVVYIYHGGLNGLPIEPSQRIAAPSNELVSYSMFGHGLSKGADIDNNHYLDIAVGSPNSEAVYIYKSYPVIRIKASITTSSQTIRADSEVFEFKVCWSFDSVHSIGFEVIFNATITLDGQIVFKDNRNEHEINGNITLKSQCINLETYILFNRTNTFKPGEIVMTYHVQNSIPSADASTGETQDFCEKCVAIDPNDVKSVKKVMFFSTGCKNTKCVADLKIKSSLENIPSLPYVLGNTSSLNIIYNIENANETAYMAKMRVELLNNTVSFSKIPSNCHTSNSSQTSNIMECDLNNGILFGGSNTSMNISVDTTTLKLNGAQLVIVANVSSAEDESNEVDNRVENKINLTEFSHIEAYGECSMKRIELGDSSEAEELTHIFKIQNNGPSDIESLDVLILLPISYLDGKTVTKEDLIDINSVSVRSDYNGKSFNVEWAENNTTKFSKPKINAPKEDLNGMQYDASNIALDYFTSSGNEAEHSNTNFDTSRKRRSIDSINKNDNFYSNDPLLTNLKFDRTIFFDCQNSEQVICRWGKFTVNNLKANNLKANNLPISITLNFTIELSKVASIMSEKKNVVVFRSFVNLKKSFENDTSTINITKRHPFTIISKNFVPTSDSLLAYIISCVVGILVMILISYAMYRFGFFNRSKRDELNHLKEQTELLSKNSGENDNQKPQEN